MKLYFVTGNENKLKEARKILAPIEIETLTLDLPEIQGSSEDIAREKVKLASQKTNKTVFVEDTCLCFNAWKELPGPYVKDFVTKIGIERFPDLLSSFDDKTAVALCTVGFCEPGKKPVVFTGEVRGSIVKPRGKTSFAWDPVFLPEDCDKTFAEMTSEEKNHISHRKIAFQKFKAWLEKNLK